MLHTQTVTGATLGLLKELMALPELNQFGLVGGTNLSLRFGHRVSIDLDLFTNEAFNMVLLPYPYLKPMEETEGIRLVSLEDIAAMKLSAIARRGVKKDFWDIAEYKKR